MTRRLAAWAAGAFLLALSVWTLAFQHAAASRGVHLAAGETEVRRLCRATGTSFEEFLRRAKAAGATAVLFPDRRLSDLVAAGEVVYFPAAQVRSLKAIGLIDPQSRFPDDTLWVQEASRAEQLARLLSDASVRYSSAAYLGHHVFSFPEGIDLDRLRAGPDPRTLKLAREAGLEPVYWLTGWDPAVRAVLRRARERADFPRTAAASPEAAPRLAEVPGLFPAGILVEGATALEVSAGDAAGYGPAALAALERGEPELLRAALPPGGVDEAIGALRAAANGLRRAGAAWSGEAGLHVAAPPDLPWARIPGALVAALAAPLAALAVSLGVGVRVRHSGALPMASPAWKLAVAYASGAAAAMAVGVVSRGLSGPFAPGLFAETLRIVPFALAAGWLYLPSFDPASRARWLDRPLRLRDLALTAALLAAAWFLWSSPPSLWHALAGAAAWLAGLELQTERGAAGRHPMDARPFLVLGLWAPVSWAAAFYASAAPYWKPLASQSALAFWGLVTGLIVLAASAFLRRRRTPAKPAWA